MPAPASERASLLDFLGLLQQRRALIALVFTLTVLTVAGVTALLPRWYLATTKIRVEKPDAEAALFQAQNQAAYDPYYLQDQFEIIQSEKILYPVLEKLELPARLGRELQAGAPLSLAQTYRYVRAKMLRVESRRASSLIEIHGYARDPRLAADLANEIARTYAEDRVAFATGGQGEGLAELRRQLEAQEVIVRTQRDLVEKLRGELAISGVDLGARYSDMEIERLRQLQNTLVALSVDAIGRKTRYERFKSIPAAERAHLVNNELVPDANIQNLLQAYLAAEQNVARLQARLGEAHPELVSARDSLAKVRSQLEAQLQGYERSLEIAWQESDARVAELRRQLDQARVDQILSARERMRPFEEAVQKLEDENRLLTTLKLTLRQREIDFQVPRKTIEILNVAEPTRTPAKPSWTLNLLAASVLGLLLGLGGAVLLEFFDASFRSVADVESRLGLPVLGVVPVLGRGRGRHAPDPVVEGEPFRVIHANLDLARRTAPGSRLVVVSAGPGEGKSTTLHQLARAMGAAGERVLLIDSDVRRPVQHRLAQRPRSPGLADWLLGRAPLDEIIHRDIAPGIDLVASGDVPEFTLGLLHAPRFQQLAADVAGRYTRILLDSPPIIGVSDAAVIVSSADSVVLLVQHRRNPASMVLRAKQTIESLGRPILGVILNQVSAGGGSDYTYYTSNYAYYRREPGEAAETRRSAGDAEAGREAARGTAPERIRLREPGR